MVLIVLDFLLGKGRERGGVNVSLFAHKIDATVSSVFTHCSTNTKYNIEYKYYNYELLLLHVR